MSFVVDYSTLEEFLESQRSLRSPSLQRSAPNFDPITTPPPLVDAPDDFASSDDAPVPADHRTASRARRKDRPRPSPYDSLLVKGLGPDYPPDIAERAGIELPVDRPDSPCEDRLVDLAAQHSPMITKRPHRDDPNSATLQDSAEPLNASKRASEKLNNALGSDRSDVAYQAYRHGRPTSYGSQYSSHSDLSKKSVKVSITSLTNDEASDALPVSYLSIQASPGDRGGTVSAPIKPTLPSLHITASGSTYPRQRHDSITESPTLSRYAITPSDGHPSQTLAKLHIQSHHSPPIAVGQPKDHRQTLPSLETALTSATDSNGTPYIDVSPSLPRPSSGQASQYGLSPAGYSHSTTPVIAMSPPRLSTNPASWRTLSNNSSTSTNSECVSGQGSGSVSTPATRLSPSQGASTPQYPGSEQGSNPDSDFGISPNIFDGLPGTSGQQGYQCTYPGCTAPPFQTQYLLNSHTNVHSNQRPHFCPVEGCPRGPGGQGFKRKNEMIRHGLVHQSPGYVCPFCPDQQHKYPRPDNLQRHVRVHHVDRDKDDPLLRDVLAQRPEGGNRGRRRRMI